MWNIGQNRCRAQTPDAIDWDIKVGALEFPLCDIDQCTAMSVDKRQNFVEHGDKWSDWCAIGGFVCLSLSGECRSSDSLCIAESNI